MGHANLEHKPADRTAPTKAWGICGDGLEERRRSRRIRVDLDHGQTDHPHGVA